MRMLMNNLHPDVAENPHELVVYGGIGRAARTWEDFDRIVATLKTLGDDETLLVQSGKPVGVFRTHPDAPRVLIANSNLVPHWATWDHFNELDRKGLMMYGQMTAGSWIYIGSQGIVQGTYETFAEAGRKHYGGVAEGQVDPDRRPRRHGRRAAAGGGLRRRLLPRGRVQPELDRLPPAHPLPRREGRDPRRGAGDDRALDGGRRGEVGGPPRQRRRRLPRAGAPRRPARTSSPTRPAPTTRSTATCRRAGRMAEWRARRESDPKAVAKAARASMKLHVAAMVEFWNARRPHARLRQQHPPDGAGGGPRRRLRLPGLRAGLHPAALLPRHRPVPLVRALRRSGGHLRAPTPR